MANAPRRFSIVKISSLFPMQPRTAAPDVQVRPEHDPGSVSAPGDPVSGTSRVSPGVLAVLDVPGVLLWTAALTLAGGAWIHASVERLPEAYTWSLPLRTLRNVIGQASFPLWALTAFAIGLARGHGGWRGIAEAVRGGVARLQDLRPRGLLIGIELRYRLALLLAVAVLALDGWVFPAHRWIDSLAMSIATFIAWVRATRRSGVSGVLNVAVGVVAFTAVCYWFTVVKTLTFAGRVQWDAQILALEKAIFGVYPHRWAAAIFAQHPSWLQLMDRAYLSIFEHMAVATGFLIGLRDARERNQFLGALCFCYVLGAPLYLLMPAAGPAYFDPSTFAFLSRQPLAVNHVQATLFDNTAAVNEGRATIIATWGYIACMPSLHMAHEFVMLYFARRSPMFFLGTLIFFLLTAVAVVALGWHYPTDILAGVVLGVVAIVISRYLRGRLFPRALHSRSLKQE